MRIATWADSESVTNNRTLQIAECLYGFNAMILVFRAFGSILETNKGVGTIQIALFHIIMDASVVVLHFAAITLAFSSTITKLFVAEVSFNKGNTTEVDRQVHKFILSFFVFTFSNYFLSKVFYSYFYSINRRQFSVVCTLIDHRMTSQNDVIKCSNSSGTRSQEREVSLYLVLNNQSLSRILNLKCLFIMILLFSLPFFPVRPI